MHLFDSYYGVSGLTFFFYMTLSSHVSYVYQNLIITIITFTQNTEYFSEKRSLL